MDEATAIRPLVVEIAEASSGRAVVVTLAGEFDLSVEKLFSEIVTDGVVQDGHASVVLDLAEITFLDSSGIRALLVARKQALASGTRLSLRRPSPAVQRVLELTAVVGAFEIAS
jgi:anti-sigma B factor antagonist